MQKEILHGLHHLEQTFNIEVLMAVESGSRAWGFASQDSDYDIRFIYKRRIPDYLSIENKQDTIELMAGDLDFAGWDLQKALKLLRKSNPPLLEWLDSPIVYLDNDGFIGRLRELSTDFFRHRHSYLHYLHMAAGNFRQYIENAGDEVILKKYLYVIRPVAACLWLEKHPNTPPPMRFDELLEAVLPGSATSIPNGIIRSEIDRLVANKQAGVELGKGSRIPALTEWLSTTLQVLNAKIMEKPTVPPVEPLDRFFVAELSRVLPV